MAGLQRFGIRIRTAPYPINTTSSLLTPSLNPRSKPISHTTIETRDGVHINDFMMVSTHPVFGMRKKMNRNIFLVSLLAVYAWAGSPTIATNQPMTVVVTNKPNSLPLVPDKGTHKNDTRWRAEIPFGSSVVITNPLDQTHFIDGKGITIHTEVKADPNTISRVEFFANNSFIGQISAPPFSCYWQSWFRGGYNLRLVTTRTNGLLEKTSSVTIWIDKDPGRKYPPGCAEPSAPSPY